MGIWGVGFRGNWGVGFMGNWGVGFFLPQGESEHPHCVLSGSAHLTVGVDGKAGVLENLGRKKWGGGGESMEVRKRGKNEMVMTMRIG